MKLEGLTTKILGRNIKYFEQIDSTQLEILRKIENKTIKNGEIIISQIQTEGIRYTWKNMVYR